MSVGEVSEERLGVRGFGKLISSDILILWMTQKSTHETKDAIWSVYVGKYPSIFCLFESSAGLS